MAGLRQSAVDCLPVIGRIPGCSRDTTAADGGRAVEGAVYEPHFWPPGHRRTDRRNGPERSPKRVARSSPDRSIRHRQWRSEPGTQ